MYEVNEDAGTVEVQFGVLGMGILDRDIDVNFNFESGTAQGIIMQKWKFMPFCSV